MDEIYLSPDIEEQIVRQLRVMARSKKLRLLQSTLNFLVKSLPMLLALAVIAALLIETASGDDRVYQQGREAVTTQTTYSADGRTKITTTTRTQTK